MKTILHVEDETTVTRLVRTILKKDYNYISVSNIKDALDIIKFKKIDLILLDLRLRREKRIDGNFEGIKLLDKVISLNTRINVVLLTALSEAAKNIKNKYPIIKAIINKPFRIAELKDDIKKFI